MPSLRRQAIAERLRDIQVARARLATLSLAELTARLPGEAARVCHLDDALLALVRDGELACGAVRTRLTACPLEAEAVARCRPQVAPQRPAFAARAGLEADTPCAVVPLVHPDRAIALLYGAPANDDLDRDLLWTFAGAVAPLLHLATLADIARPPVVEPLAHRRRRS